MKTAFFAGKQTIITLFVLLSLFEWAQCAHSQEDWSQEKLPAARYVLTPDSKIINEIASLASDHLEASRYDELEKLAAEFRDSKEVLVTGEWKLGALYDGTARQLGHRDERSLTRLNKLKDWAKARPESITAQVALAHGLMWYGWTYRGGLARSATDEQMKVFEEHMTQARVVLREAKKFPEKCPYWWVVAQRVAQAQGWDRKTYDGLFAEAIQFEPECEEYYFQKLGYILVNWVGIEDEWQKYALAAADKIGGEKGDILYARMIWHMDRERHIGKQYSNAAVSFQRVDRGFQALHKRHPDSLLVLNAWARLCRMIGSSELAEKRKARARELYRKIGPHADSSVWPRLSEFQDIRDATFDVPNYYDLGIEKLDSGDAEGAIAELTKFIAKYPRRPEAFNVRGLAKLKLNQSQAALADFNQATTLLDEYANPRDAHPNAAAFYVNQAVALNNLEKWKLAIESANRAIQISPGIFQPYVNRGGARYATGDIKGALEDYATAIEIDPEIFDTYHYRGQVKADLRDYPGAIEDFTEAIALDPEGTSHYSNRAFIFYNSQKWKESLADFRKFLSMAKPDANTEYHRIYIWLIRARLGETAAANRELKAHLTARKKPDEWSGRVGAFLVGELTQAALLAEAEDKDPVRLKEKQTEAFFYAGMKHLLAGEKPQAAEYFQKVLDLKLVNFTEFVSAEAELKVLQAKP